MDEPTKATPLPWLKPVLGIYKSDLDRIGAKNGGWVGVKYQDSGKTISIKTQEREQRTGWPDNLVWIGKQERIDLGLPDISDRRVGNPPEELKVHIWAHFFPRGGDLFRVLFAFITFGFTTSAATLKTISFLLPETDPLQIYIGAALYIIAILGAIGALLTVFLQKQ